MNDFFVHQQSSSIIQNAEEFGTYVIRFIRAKNFTRLNWRCSFKKKQNLKNAKLNINK